VIRRKIKDAQQREVLARLHETNTTPKTLEAFEQSDLERMIRDVTSKKQARRTFARTRPNF
jgi:hypothetical protein